MGLGEEFSTTNDTFEVAKNNQRWDLYSRPTELNEYFELELLWVGPPIDSSSVGGLGLH